MKELNPTAASLLGFLARKPLTGWNLAKAVDNSIGYFWNVTRSQIYRELNDLEKSGMVEAGEAGVRDKKTYTITSAGKQAFKTWIAQEPSKELFRFPLLLSVFFGEEIEIERLRAFLEIHRIRHQERLKEYQQIEKNLSTEDDQSIPASTVKFGIRFEKMVLEWIASLSWLKGNPPPKRRSKK